MAVTKAKAVLAVYSCMIILMGVMISGGSADDPTWQEVLTTARTNVVYGASNTYTIRSRTSGIGYLFRFFFGLGFPGEAVRTDTTVTMGRNGDASAIYACINGRLQLVATNTSGTPQNSLIRVRYNSTDGYYRLQITQASPAVYVQFVLLSQGGILCTEGLPGTPITFTSSSSTSSSSSSSDMHVLHQVVDSSSLA